MNFFKRLFGKKTTKDTKDYSYINEKAEEVGVASPTDPTKEPEWAKETQAFDPPPPDKIEDLSGNGHHLTSESHPTPESVAKATISKRRASNGRFVKGIGGLDCVARDASTGRFKSKV